MIDTQQSQGHQARTPYLKFPNIRSLNFQPSLPLSPILILSLFLFIFLSTRKKFQMSRPLSQVPLRLVDQTGGEFLHDEITLDWIRLRLDMYP